MPVLTHRRPTPAGMAPLKPREPVKRALLVGINYEEDASASTLCGAHDGVMELTRLLTEEYDYDLNNIVNMLDSPSIKDEKLRPTRDNILRQIDIMVQDARPGDQFFFHYSGHSGQVTNRNNTEEDDMDEVIIDMNGNDLIDNELRAHLVDPLPAGSKLVALLDTCHSGSLLDLPHHRCNRVFTPRISKGNRKSDILWNRVVRRDDVLITTEESWTHHNRNGLNYCSTDSNIKTTSIDDVSLGFHPRHWHPVESRSLPVVHELAEPMPSFAFAIPRCDSPTPLWECEGNCERDDSQPEELAHVICISACKDEQRSWEGPDGASITKELINVLRQNANPSLKELMTQLSHRIHEQCLKVHRFTQQHKQNRPQRRGRSFPHSRAQSFDGEMDNFQDPQIASHTPLNMEESFTL